MSKNTKSLSQQNSLNPTKRFLSRNFSELGIVKRNEKEKGFEKSFSPDRSFGNHLADAYTVGSQEAGNVFECIPVDTYPGVSSKLGVNRI
jgi:hypothetical protein